MCRTWSKVAFASSAAPDGMTSRPGVLRGATESGGHRERLSPETLFSASRIREIRSDVRNRKQDRREKGGLPAEKPSMNALQQSAKERLTWASVE